MEQKISLASAAAVMARVDGLVVSTGAGWSANRLLSIDRERFREAGTTYAKADCLHAIAREVAAGTLDFAALSAWPDAEVLRKLTTVRGIGPWTAGVFLTLALRRPDAWPPGDRALAVSYAETFGLARATSYRELDGFAEAWRPHRGAAARLLWHAYLARRKSVEE
ncbi:MAG: DNA-3-methyladenine glycosylase 2 family protein [Planctomycetota bacterium]